MPSTHQKKPDADSDPEFTVNYNEDVEMNKPQVVSVKTRENVKKVEIAVLYPNGQAKMYRSRMRVSSEAKRATLPMTNWASFSCAYVCPSSVFDL